MKFCVIIILLQKFTSQWCSYDSYLTSNTFYKETTSSDAYINTEGFIKPLTTYTTANFINCSSPPKSYITLNQLNPEVEIAFKYFHYNGSVFSFDLYFHGTWNNQFVSVNIGNFSEFIYYTSPSAYYMDSGFCNNTPYEVQTFNYQFITYQEGKMSFQSSNNIGGMVSIANIVKTYLRCYPSCNQCYGPAYNQCSRCLYGETSGSICPGCPINKYYVKFQGCKDICDFDSKLFKNGFCQEYPVNYFKTTTFSSSQFYVENLKWSIIYDKNHIDTSITIGLLLGSLTYGIFKYNSGIQRYVSEINANVGTYLIGFKIQMIIFGNLQINEGINFKLNNTYYGSIFQNSSGIQTHHIQIYDSSSIGSYLQYSNCYRYEFHMFFDIPSYPFLFSSSSNFTQNSVGWGLVSFSVNSGYCPQNCKECDVSFQCKTCETSYLKYRDGRCIGNCDYLYQKSNGTYCFDYDDETPCKCLTLLIDSEYLIKEYIDYANDPTQNDQYIIISQSQLPNKNFLKGINIYHSYVGNYRVFGGPYVWACAKFQRVHQIQDPHHSITIGFQIIFGPNFPPNGIFIYTIESKPSVSITSSNGYLFYADGTQHYRVYEKINHTGTMLNMYWECQGDDNEPIRAYCAFFKYYIAVHYCQPFCLECTNENACTLWNSTYDSNVIKFSQSDCSINQYYDGNQVKCLNCPSSCITCFSPIDCQSCQATYTLTKLGCVCKQNQYEESGQCYDCPPLCKQCQSLTFCIECFFSDFRELVDGQCVCFQGYYQVESSSVCLQCNLLCKECFGATFNDCKVCRAIVGIQQIDSTCQCQDNTVYEELSNSCINCHSTCKTCFTKYIDGCLTCDETLHRILKGLKCECSIGYYENANTCQQCPVTVDTSLPQCYVLCEDNQLTQYWYSSGCSACDQGFQLVNAECLPICGDLQVVGNEECDDNNTDLNDKCYNCRFQCPANCLTCNIYTVLPCSDICGDGLVTGNEECEDGNNIQFDGCYNCKFQCQESCTRCLIGECFECTEGWYIDPYTWRCKERCGDQMIVGEEQCEDGNQIETDGCKACRFFCRIGCSICDYVKQLCVACEFPGFIPNEYYCQNNCGDGIIAVDPYGFYSEVCEDIGCNSSCNQCKQGYQLKNTICEPICHDSLLVEKEICESSFILPYKGCQNCKIKCQSSCLECDTQGKGCLKCDVGYKILDHICYSKCGDQIITVDEECDDGNLIIGDGCHFCNYSCQDFCLNCVKGECLYCLENDQLAISNCQLKYDNNIANPLVQYDYIINSNNGYYQYLQCSENCKVCLNGVCLICQTNFEVDNMSNHCIPTQLTRLEIQQNCLQVKDNLYLRQRQSFIDFITNPEIQMERCSENCKICQFNACIECEQGYYGKMCLSKCGDKIIVLEEECDEGKSNLTNKCYNCRLICSEFCQFCVFGICKQCQSEYYLDESSNTCQPICGDNVLAPNEVCDDGNDIAFDGCFECQFQCEVKCRFCQFGRCAQCLETLLLVQSNGKCEPLKYCEAEAGFYYESITNSCINLCGDGIVAGKEDCDDTNQIPYDGCYDCKFQCKQQCQLCDKGICLLEPCPLGARWVNNSCCGDAILNGDEECDDGNHIDYDGCSNCRFQCHQFCNICLKGICEKCIDEYTVDQNKCVKNESILSDNEDSIHLKYNQDQICLGDECAFSLKPKMSLIFLNQTFSHQYVEINFNQQIKYQKMPNKNQFQNFKIQIQNLSEQYYNIQLYPIRDISYDLQDVQYIADIEIFLDLQEKPILQITLIQTVVNCNNQTIIEPYQSIFLQEPRIMNEELKSKAVAISKTNKAFMISAITISIVSFIFGDASLFIETLNTLQYQSYLKFINLEYPENLQMYFQTSETLLLKCNLIISLSNYLSNLQINYILGVITGKEEEQIRVDGKFAQYDVDCDLILNLIPQLLQLIILLTLIFNSKKIYLMYKNFFSTKFSRYDFFNLSRGDKLMVEFALIVGQQIQKIIKYRYQFSLRLIMPILSLNAWDILFKLLLQIHINKLQNAREQFQYLLSLSLILLYLAIVLQQYSKSTLQNIKSRKDFLQIRYETLDIFRTFFFHIVLVFFQKHSIIQSLLIAINSILQCYFIQKYQQVNKLDKFVHIITEATVALFSLTTYIYYKENLFSYQTFVKAGFFHMGIFMLSLTFILCKQILQKIQIISSKVHQYTQKKKINS